ncbi:lipocalin family protein [Variovorax sp. GT1P44]|uniref:lipocalin family protein n=1 Tax=Variovorax sp. GT1P44 TaxID=3443742 RepID=UPI003F46FE40
MSQWIWSSTAGLAVLLLATALPGCAHSPPTIPAVPQVDLDRFMGDWYVIAHIPTRFERDAFNALESYALRPDGSIQTTFQYRNGSFDAPVKTLRPIGRVRPGTANSVWGMQFIWPVEAEYVIVYLSDDYGLTIIGRSDRDYAWIMARSPHITDSDYTGAVRRLRDLGYATDGLRRVPQNWPARDR